MRTNDPTFSYTREQLLKLHNSQSQLFWVNFDIVVYYIWKVYYWMTLCSIPGLGQFSYLWELRIRLLRILTNNFRIAKVNYFDIVVYYIWKVYYWMKLCSIPGLGQFPYLWEFRIWILLILANNYLNLITAKVKYFGLTWIYWYT